MEVFLFQGASSEETSGHSNLRMFQSKSGPSSEFRLRFPQKKTAKLRG